MSRFAGRGRDKLWFSFFALHIPISLFLDLQAIYPPSIVPDILQRFLAWSVNLTRDPVLLGAASGSPAFDWLRCFMWMEAVFQVPCFVVGCWALWNNDKRVYPVLLAYGASTATTVIPCIQAILNAKATPPHTTAEITNLLSQYVPFFFLPFGLAVDMSMRIIKIIAAAEGRKSV